MGVAERRERERCERRQQIIEAAERVFIERGAGDATMGDVAAEAELSKGTLYLYFASKDELYIAMSARTLTMLGEQVDEATPEDCTGLQAMRAMMAAHRQFAREHPDRIRFLLAWMAAGFHADPAAGAYADYLQRVGQVMARATTMIERGQRDGSVRADLDPMATVMQMWGGSMGMSMLFLNRSEVSRRVPDALDFDGVYDGYAELMLRGIAADGETLT